MKQMLLLGAGASVEAGVPTSFRMTERLANDQQALGKHHSDVVRFVISGLLFQKGIQGDNPLEGVDVEDLFSALMLLADRNELQAAPFVGSWHAMVDQLDRSDIGGGPYRELNRLIYRNVTDEIIKAFPSHSPGFKSSDIDQRIFHAMSNLAKQSRSGSYYLSSNMGVGKAVADYVKDITNTWLSNLRSKTPSGESALQSSIEGVVRKISTTGKGRMFRSTADRMIRMLHDLVWIDAADKVDYLAPIASVLKRQTSFIVATLNYDNSIELLASNAGVDCTTGIESWSEKGAFPEGVGGILLLKLHGSIDWEMESATPSADKPMPHNVIRKASLDQLESKQYRPAVIFGQRNKLTAEGPFLDLLRAFRSSLEGVDRLNVIGYSFRDEHINELISRWLNQSQSRTITVIDPGIDERSISYFEQLRENCGARLEFHKLKASEGIAQLFCTTK